MARIPVTGGGTGQLCPECGYEIIYNGNYFCSRFGDGCDWALPDFEQMNIDEAMLLMNCYLGLMERRKKEPEAHHLMDIETAIDRAVHSAEGEWYESATH